MRVFSWLRQKWCDVVHGGGRVLRDPQGRINWRCDTCGRWSDSPVPLAVERRLIDADIRAASTTQPADAAGAGPTT